MKFTVRWATSLLFLGGCLLASDAAVGASDASPADDSSRTAIAVEALSRLKGMDLEANPAVKKAVLKVLEQTRGTPQFVELVRDFNLPDQEAALLEFATQHPASSTGAEAIRLVLRRPDDGLLKTSLAGTNALPIVEAMGNTGENGIVPLLLPLVTDPAHDVATRKQAVRALAQVQTGAAGLLKLAEEKKLPADLRLAASSALNNVRWEDLKNAGRAAFAIATRPRGAAVAADFRVGEAERRSGKRRGGFCRRNGGLQQVSSSQRCGH